MCRPDPIAVLDLRIDRLDNKISDIERELFFLRLSKRTENLSKSRTELLKLFMSSVKNTGTACSLNPVENPFRLPYPKQVGCGQNHVGGVN